ncbi:MULTISPECIES: DUF6722 family protein [Parabacteroides]|jgi:hypothetical protein|uniref:DUF6722 family protein n=1 Tax=Parabacteroides TaxID=375288 RepID=UPI000EFE1DDE|nr:MULTISPECIES: DUF6722 family protein [Parabacteroides]MCS2893224.1 hypothetical protein [Parabacteroides faecis]RHR43196.1 hypothetical protein DWX23_01360 [Parabacteroides sp. AF18-52]UVQ48166.1 hypothetical protein NXY11_08055 [Parabacteroides faecis]
MGKFIVQQEKQKVRKETMGKYFYDLSRLTFAAMVLGGIISFFQGIEIKWCYVVLLGLIVVFAFARIGNNILK